MTKSYGPAVRSGILYLLLITLLAVPCQSQTQDTAAGRKPSNSANRSSLQAQRGPKLVLVITVDQFRYDFLERFGPIFGGQGFRRLMTGAVFTNANYDYVPTYTAPGHAAIFTGAGPAQNGIVGNLWFDRETGKLRVMVSDLSARMVTDSGVTGDPGVASPRVLIGATIGDQLRLSNNFKSKVIAVSLKDRAAVLPGGHHPNGAFWFDTLRGSFVTSDYYSKELPVWVKQFNSTQGPARFFGAKWVRSLKPEAYLISQTQNMPVQKSTLGTEFPYTITGGDEKPGAKFHAAFEMTPFASEYLADFAKAAIQAEQLGSDEFPDLLSVSFSSPDLAGHFYGPDSQEIEDTYFRLDGVIAGLLNFIDSKVGLANTIVAVSGDHGVMPVPEYLESLGFDAGRLDPKDIRGAVNDALKQRFGDEKWVLEFVNDQFYLDRKLIAERKLNVSDFERVAGEAALTVPGIVDFFTRTQILEGRMPSNNVARRVVNGFSRARSGDVWIVNKPFTFVAEGRLPTTHGSPYNYDTHVPVILFGAGVRPGRYHMECAPTDIAPTLAALLGIEPPPVRVGRVLPAVGDH
jgi:predicted AlkP superfamily pyrophosphatase or phosphodiesterase